VGRAARGGAEIGLLRGDVWEARRLVLGERAMGSIAGFGAGRGWGAAEVAAVDGPRDRGMGATGDGVAEGSGASPCRTLSRRTVDEAGGNEGGEVVGEVLSACFWDVGRLRAGDGKSAVHDGSPWAASGLAGAVRRPERSGRRGDQRWRPDL
jgi:hypothetical protein